MAAKLIGFNALAPERTSKSRKVEESKSEDRLEKGPAYEISNLKSQISNSADWPTYRHDAQRSGHAASPVPAELHVRWQAEVGGRLSAATVAVGRVFAACVDQQRIGALDADSGKPVWQFATFGPILFSPVIAYDCVFFICGGLYCLDAATGTVRWEFWKENWVEREPVVADSFVYTAINTTVYCLDAPERRAGNQESIERG